MKKLFTLFIAAASAISAWAAAPQLLFGSEPAQPGVTYETGYTSKAYEIGTMVMTTYTQDADLFVKGVIGSQIVVEVKASEPVAVCSIDGTCQDGTNVTKTGKLQEGIYTVSIDGNIIVDGLGIHKEVTDRKGTPADELLNDITVEVKVYYAATPAEYATAKVHMTKKPASEVGGVADAVSNNTIRPISGNTLEYSMNEPTKFALYGINGSLVMSQKIYSNGTISLDALHPGIYIYKAGTQTGKIIIRKH